MRSSGSKPEFSQQSTAAIVTTTTMEDYPGSVAADAQDEDGLNVSPNHFERPGRDAVRNEDLFEIQETLTMGHIFDEGTKHSAEEKKKSAMSHFDSFLKLYYKHKPYILDGEPIGIPNHKDLTVNDIKDDLVGKYATYLGKIATTKDQKKSPLAYTTARGYFSSFKIYYLQKFRDDGTPEVLRPEKFKMYATGLTSVITERCKKSNEPLVAQKARANKEDWVALAILCAWSGRVDCYEFWHFNNNTTQMAARGNEVAYFQHSQIRSETMEESFQTSYNLASVFVNIWKQTTSQVCLICPHIDSWQLDWYFSGAVLLAMSQGESPYVFPTYGERANREDNRSKRNSSGVSSLWTEKFKALGRYQSELRRDKAARSAANPDEEQDLQTLGLTADSSFSNITSHAGKQYAVQLMGQSLTKLIQIIYRAGWDVQNSHSLFDYLQRETLHDLEAAKACAGWNTKLYDKIYGGYTNKLEDLTESADKFDVFCTILFRDHGQSIVFLSSMYRIEKKVLHLYGFSVLRFLGNFVESMAAHPTNKWGDGNNHLFVKMVAQACSESGISEAVFKQWQKDVIKSFNTRNAFALSSEKIVDASIEGRNLIQMNTTLVNLVNAQAVAMKNLSEMVYSMAGDIKYLKKKFENVSSARTNSPRQANDVGALQQPAHSPASPSLQSAPLLSYSDLLRTGQEMSLLDISFCWFRYDVRKLYVYERDTLGSGQRAESNKLANHFSSIKSTMHVIIKCLRAYPTEKPEVPARIVGWERDVKAALRLALEDLKQVVGAVKLTKSKVKKLVDNYKPREFPPNTPVEVQAFFNYEGRNNRSKRSRAGAELGDEPDRTRVQRNA
eukprot:scaffold7504_cov97-Cylindrotheca_fusiformis.AAC.6